MRNFRLLNASEIECRISETKMMSNGKGYVRLLLYKTARTDAALLDEKFGMTGWQNRYECIDGKMYCGIGIRSEGEWIWKWNVGTESNTEAEKGQASDALKRAGFTLGIGTELYSAPDITIWSPTVEIKDAGNGKARCYERFDVKEIGYDKDENINLLVIVNSKGKEVFRMGGYGKAKQAVQGGSEARRGDLKPQVTNPPLTDETSLKTASGEPKATTEQVEEIKKLSKDVNSILRYYKVEKLEDLPIGTAEDVIQRLRKARGV